MGRVYSENFERVYFRESPPSRNGEITLPFTDVGKSCYGRDFLKSLIHILTLFAKIKLCCCSYAWGVLSWL